MQYLGLSSFDLQIRPKGCWLLPFRCDVRQKLKDFADVIVLIALKDRQRLRRLPQTWQVRQ